MVDKSAIESIIDSLENPGEVYDEERTEGYSLLYQNIKMMKVLQKMMVEDTKQMMKSDCFKDEFTRGARYGMFLRTKSIYDKAKELYEKQANEKPISVDK